MKNPELSIIILNYNTQKLLKGCIESLIKVKSEANFEIIIVDNGSFDKSVAYIKKLLSINFGITIKLVENRENFGFAKGNNQAENVANGKYILFLNSDTVMEKTTISKSLDYIKQKKDIGALSCKIVLPDGKIDKDTRRSFITPWIGLTHIYLKLDRIFPKSKLFSKYWYGYINPDITHEVDAIQGAFFLTRKKILDQVGWWDEDYFLDGEDIDLCWRIKKAGWKIIYFPRVSIIHYKGATKGKNANRLKKGSREIPLKEKIKYKLAGVNSMELFVRKRLRLEYPRPIVFFVIIGIKLLKIVRIIMLYITG